MKADLKTLQVCETEILKEFVKICDENNLKYYLAYGTLLGAKRHNGFIPWDDDVDVAMPRADYDRFCSEVHSKLPEHLKFRSYLCDVSYDSYVPRIENQKVIMTDTSGKENYAWIDLFPIDGMPPQNTFSNWIHKKKLIYTRIKINLARMSSGINFESVTHSKIKKVIIKVLSIINIGKFLNSRILYDELNVLLKRYSADETKNCVDFMGEKFKDECPFFYYGSGRELIFEGMSMRVPQKTEELLVMLYGDYMQLPPEEKRNVHSLKSVRMNEKVD